MTMRALLVIGCVLGFGWSGSAMAEPTAPADPTEPVDLLEASRAWLSVLGSQHLTVMLGDDKLGQTPIVDAPVFAGRHKLAIYHGTELIAEHEILIEPGEHMDWTVPVIDVADLREQKRQTGPRPSESDRALLKVRPSFAMPSTFGTKGVHHVKVRVLVDERGRIAKRAKHDCELFGDTPDIRHHRKLCIAVMPANELLQEAAMNGMKQARWWPMERQGTVTPFVYNMDVRFVRN